MDAPEPHKKNETTKVVSYDKTALPYCKSNYYLYCNWTCLKKVVFLRFLSKNDFLHTISYLSGMRKTILV